MKRIKHFLSALFYSKKRNLSVLCFLLLGLISNPAYAGGFRNFIIERIFGIDSRIDPGMAERNMRNMHMHRLQQQEHRRVFSEDTERVRILLNDFDAYERARYLTNSKETIELRITPARVRPGETVWFEAIPSSETPDLGPGLRLWLGGRDFHLPSLSRGWFGNTYRGSFRTSPGHAVVYTFRIVTPLGHHSNTASVVVAPDCSQLSWIRIHRGVLYPPTTTVGIIEGSTTSPPIELLAESRRGWMFFGPRERFFLSSPALGIQWIIEDESIAVIAEERGDGIVLKGLARGETTLRARYGSLEAQVRINVMPPFMVHPDDQPPPPSPSRLARSGLLMDSLGVWG